MLSGVTAAPHQRHRGSAQALNTCSWLLPALPMKSPTRLAVFSGYGGSRQQVHRCPLGYDREGCQAQNVALIMRIRISELPRLKASVKTVPRGASILSSTSTRTRGHRLQAHAGQYEKHQSRYGLRSVLRDGRRHDRKQMKELDFNVDLCGRPVTPCRNSDNAGDAWSISLPRPCGCST